MVLQTIPDSSINTVARIVSAPLLGVVAAQAGPGACFGLASLFAALAAATALIRRVVVLRGFFA